MNYANEIKRGALLLLCTPGFLLLATFYGLVVATRIHVGHWPYYHYPDAGVWSTVPYPYWHLAVMILFLATILSFPAGLVFAIFGSVNKRNSVYAYSILCVITCISAIALLANDPGEFVNWFMD